MPHAPRCQALCWTHDAQRLVSPSESQTCPPAAALGRRHPPPPPSFPGRAGVGSESANERGATAHFAEGEIGVAWGPCLTFFMPQNRAMNTTPLKEQNCHQVSEWQSWDLHRVLPPLGPSPVGAAGAGFLLGLGLGAAGWGGARGQAGVPRAAASVLVLGWVRIPHRGHAIVQQR